VKFVDWVERVLRAVLATAADGQAALIGAPFAQVVEDLGLDGTPPEFERSREAGALADALIELRDLGILEDAKGFHNTPGSHRRVGGLPVALCGASGRTSHPRSSPRTSAST
jgi:hypothetical protein